MSGALCLVQRNEQPDLQRQRDTEESPQTGLARFPPGYYNFLVLFLRHCSCPIKTSTEVHRSVSLGRLFLINAPIACKPCINKLDYTFLWLLCLRQFTFQTRPGTLRESRKTFSFPTYSYEQKVKRAW